jgi:predicted transposase/invertase (TIGR01784 family)
MTPRPHDALFKAAFEHPEHAGALLRSILPPAIRDAIDWTTLTHEPGSFIDRELDDDHADLLFAAKLVASPRDLDSAYLYVLFEHRSTPERYLPRRMLANLDGIWELHCKQGGPLPIVIPILI